MKKLTILSLGAGVQSSTLALMAMHSEIPKIDYAIFADTGWEPANVLIWLDWLEKQLDFPVIRVKNGNLLEDLTEGLTNNSNYFTPPPFFVLGGSISKRQCTSNYKILPIYKKIRDLCGLQPYERVKDLIVTQYIGISLDEAHRAKPSRYSFINNNFPLLDLRMTRADCFQWMKKHGYPEPPRSACVCCPFHSDYSWQELKSNHKSEFENACEIDELASQQSKVPEFLHRSLKPLDSIQFTNTSQSDLFGNECDGICAT